MPIDKNAIIISLVTLLIVGAIITILGIIILEPDFGKKENVSAVENKVIKQSDKFIVENKLVYSSDLDSSSLTNEQLTQIHGTGLYINNENPKDDFEKGTYQYVAFGLEKANISYQVPSNWNRNLAKMYDPFNGHNVEGFSNKTSNIINEIYKETTYKELIEAFIANERNNSVEGDNVDITTRDLVTDEGTYPIIVKKEGFTVTSYIVFVKELYEYHLKFVTTLDEYNDKTIEIIDNVFRSFKVY